MYAFVISRTHGTSIYIAHFIIVREEGTAQAAEKGKSVVNFLSCGHTAAT
jgi:hypothetical protein